MKALTIKQPYAWAIFNGKNVENRSQAWKYRGPLAIHSGITYSRPGHDEIMEILGFCLTSSGVLKGELPNSAGGAILGVVDLVDIHTGWEGCCPPWGHRGSRAHLVLENPRSLLEPTPCRGQLGLWTPPEPILTQLVEFAGGAA